MKFKKVFVYVCAFSLFVNSTSIAFAQQKKNTELRALTVGVAVTPEFQKNPEWKAIFKKRLKYASRIFEREFQVKFQNALFWTWKSETTSLNAKDLMDDLMKQYPLQDKKVDFIIGLSRLDNVTDIANVNDVDVLGLTRPMSGYVFLRYPNNPLFKIQEETVLIHELGHLFGATHTEQRDTIMYPYVDRHIPTSFDGVNRNIIRSLRALDFKYGPDAFKTGALQNLVNSYSQVNIHNQHPEFFYALANLYMKLGEHEKALDAFSNLRNIRLNDGRVRYDMGILYSRVGRYDEAVKELNEAIHHLDRDKNIEILGRTYDALGQMYFHQDNMPGAERSWRKALEIVPDNLDAKINLAIVQIKLGQINAAVPVLEKANKKDPENIKVIGYLGVASYLQKKYTQAITHFNEALRILNKKTGSKPEESADKFLYSEIYSGMGSTYWALERKEDATRYFTKACDIDGSVTCNERLGKIYYELGEWDATVAQLAPIIQQDPTKGDIYGVLGVALSRQGDTQNALGIFQQGLKYVDDRTKLSQLHGNSGHLLLQNEQYDMAIQEFMSAVSKDWNNEEAHLGLALGYLYKSKPYDAKQVLRNLLSVNPNHPKVPDVMKEVDKMIEELGKQQGQIEFQIGPKSS
jgi:tetratricopeptide (TPR) repeat protein/predicted Zn-dependent protease